MLQMSTQESSTKWVLFKCSGLRSYIWLHCVLYKMVPYKLQSHHSLVKLNGHPFHFYVTDESYTLLHLKPRGFNSCHVNYFCPHSTISAFLGESLARFILENFHSFLILKWMSSVFLFPWPLLCSYLFLKTK